MTDTTVEAEGLVPADIDWPAYAAEIATALADRDPGEAWVDVFECLFTLFEAIGREQDLPLALRLALTCEAGYRDHACAQEGEPEPPVATLADIGGTAASGDLHRLLGHAFGLWLHAWRCSVRRSDYDELARLAGMWVARVREYPPAQVIPAAPPQF